MCHEWTQRDTEATQPRQEPEERPASAPDRQPVWEKTSPRGNQELDDHDLDRGLERLESLVGH